MSGLTYAASVGGVLAALAATGGVGYFTARGVAGPAPNASAHLRAAAVGNNGSDYGYTGYCGVERHDVKDLTDGFVPGAPQDSSITALRALPVPAGAAAGRTPPEQVVYRVAATAQAYKIEADSDVHLAIADPADPSATMIAEFPAASCLAQSSDAPAIEAARADMIAALGDPPTGTNYTDLSPAPCVTLTGVAFFDRIHGQRGVAPNGIELHPVLSFQAGCGSPAPPVTQPTAPVTTEPPDTAPVTTVPLTTTQPARLVGCRAYPGRHWYRHRYHYECRSFYFTSP
jgi:hypothetical protein